MDYLNIDLSSVSEREQEILEGYSFDTLLLEINCNLTEINETTVRAQFELSLKSNITTAREIFNANLKNIVIHAVSQRKSNL